MRTLPLTILQSRSDYEQSKWRCIVEKSNSDLEHMSRLKPHNIDLTTPSCDGHRNSVSVSNLHKGKIAGGAELTHVPDPFVRSAPNDTHLHLQPANSESKLTHPYVIGDTYSLYHMTVHKLLSGNSEWPLEANFCGSIFQNPVTSELSEPPTGRANFVFARPKSIKERSTPQINATGTGTHLGTWLQLLKQSDSNGEDLRSNNTHTRSYL